jgi:hypothetical protein
MNIKQSVSKLAYINQPENCCHSLNIEEKVQGDKMFKEERDS